nr:DUF1028 domain-containing protein [candidate division Zixibacteria bacterium]
MVTHFACQHVLNRLLQIFVAACCIGAFSTHGASIRAQSVHEQGQKVTATFSIIARDSATGELGVAVASRFFAVGVVVPWAKADVGAVATQSYANTTFGWRGLELLEQGATPEQVVEILVREDNDPERRQFGIVAADGKSATYTGKECLPWAGGRNGLNYAVQGNILVSEEVVTAMERVFLETKGTLAE